MDDQNCHRNKSKLVWNVLLISKVDNIQKPFLSLKSGFFPLVYWFVNLILTGQTWYQKFILTYPPLESPDLDKAVHRYCCCMTFIVFLFCREGQQFVSGIFVGVKRTLLSLLEFAKNYAPNSFNCLVVLPFWAKSNKHYSRKYGKLILLSKQRAVIALGFFLIRVKLKTFAE